MLAMGSAVFAVLPVGVGDGVNPAWTGAIEYARANGERPLYSVGIDSNQAGRFYLAGLGWPEPVDRDYDFPSDAIIVRTPDFDDAVPTGERTLYREERVMLTEPVSPAGASPDDASR